MKRFDAVTGFVIADAQEDPCSGLPPSFQDIQEAYRPLIVSASGWRKIFVASGNQEDASESVSKADVYLTAMAAVSIARHIGFGKLIVLGIDARPTGAALAYVALRMFLACNLAVRYVFIASAPEIMADSALHDSDAFFYISASHNPIGHNGFKIGRAGGVLNAAEVKPIIEYFQTMVGDERSIQEIRNLSASVSSDRIEKVFDSIPTEKSAAMDRYCQLLFRTLADSKDPAFIATAIGKLRNQIASHPIGIVGELNGSARCVSVDRQFFEALNIRTVFINDTCRQIVHPIVPEGENLEMCRLELEKAYRIDHAFQIGYVPDNDGDRGNVVYITPSDGKAHILGAQQLFALVAAVELANARKTHHRVAIAVNGPTSLLIDTIAKALDVTVARAEVGEANVVLLAEHLRSDGYTVRILGEGSNGGNITHPCKVRDPMNTLVSLVKLLTDENLFRLVVSKDSPSDSVLMNLEHALESLPKRIITGGFSEQAVMKVRTTDHGALKTAYEKIFAREWDERSAYLRERFGICSWEEQQTEGIYCRTGIGCEFRSGRGTGGLKIIFFDDQKQATDFIWMRGSQTEPVFRIMADATGTDQDRHDYLLAWQRQMVEQADSSLHQR